jgi:hypothetical protein
MQQIFSTKPTGQKQTDRAHCLSFGSAQERLLAPQGITPSETNATPREGAGLIPELIETEGQMLACQDQMVAIWTEYQKLRLALFRDLGDFPFHDWASFYEHFTARVPDSRPR